MSKIQYRLRNKFIFREIEEQSIERRLAYRVDADYGSLAIYELI